jgi:hypothetical protein
MNNPQLIQWKEFNTTIKQRVNTLYNVIPNPAKIMGFCTYLKSRGYSPRELINDDILKREYTLWCELGKEGQIEYLNLVSRMGRMTRMRPNHSTDEDPINITN